MQEVQVECPPPPIDHLEQQREAALDNAEYVYDRTKGNPGRPAKQYVVVNAEEESNPAAATRGPGASEAKTEPKDGATVIREPLSEDEQKVETAMQEISAFFPEVAEHWLRKCVHLRMVQDKWDLERTVSYIFDNENIAPRKPPKIRLSNEDNLESQKASLLKHRAALTDQYKFYSEVKLNEMFPRLSTESIRRIFVAFNSHFMPTAITIAEALEDYFEQERKSWDDIDRLDWIWLRIRRDGAVYKYAVQVVRGMKIWLKKKKGRKIGFPRLLLQEMTIVETWLEKMRQKRLKQKEKREEEERYARAIEDAKWRGETSECAVCGKHYRPEFDAVHCSAGHEFCFLCLRNVCWEVVTGQVKLSLNGEVDCLSSGCPGTFSYRTIERTVEPDHLPQIEEIHIGNMIAASNMDNVVRCNYCHYVAVVEVPPEVNKVFACQNPACMREVCRLCGETWKGHEGRGCRPKEQTDEMLQRMKYEEAMTSILTRQCAKCKALIVKDTGCNKVACRCGATICYMCRAPGIGYDHFCRHVFANRNQAKCDQCSACQLYGNVAQHDEEQLQRMRLKFELDRLAKLQSESVPRKAPTVPAKAAGAAAADPGAAFQRQFG